MIQAGAALCQAQVQLCQLDKMMEMKYHMWIIGLDDSGGEGGEMTLLIN